MSVSIRGGSLKQRFEEFVRTINGFENIDELLKGRDPQGKMRADYLFADRSIIIEQKILESDPGDKPQKFIEKLMADGRFRAYGTVSTDVIFSKLSDGETLKAEMFARLTKVLDDDVAKADKQTRDTRKIFEIPDAMGVLVVLNAKASTLVPDTVRYGLQRVFMKKLPDGSFRYGHNTGVIVLSELHSVARENGLRLMPMMQFAFPDTSRTDQFTSFSNRFIEKWATFNGMPLLRTTHEEIAKAR